MPKLLLPEPGATVPGLRRRVWLTCLAVMVGAVLYDFLSPPNYTATLFLTVPTPLAACALSMRDTVLTAVVSFAVAVAMLLGWHSHQHGDAMSQLWVMLALIGISLYVSWERTRRERELATTRAVAEITQRAVLPALPEKAGALHIAARYQAAYTVSRIGGDFYAVEPTPSGVRAVVGDVRGKGLSTIGSVTALTGSFREAAHHAAGLPEMADWMEESQLRITALDSFPESDEWFSTALLVEVDAAAGELRMLNCGHPHPLRLRGHRVDELDTGTPRMPLGLRPLGRGAGRGEVTVADWRPGDVLVMFTDGLVEARDRDGAFYDPAPLLAERGAGLPLDLLLRHLGDDATRHSGGRLADDLALLALG